jgi:type VI secretion system protein ImpH
MENRVNIRKLVKSRAMYLRQGVYAPDFWGFVRRLENSNPELPRLGYARHPSLENIRFGQAPFLGFPSADIAEIVEGKGNIDAAIFTYFFGLLGVNGPMPLEFTNYVYQRSRNHYDHTWRRFLDIINHRFTVFFYRAFSQNEQAISFDRVENDAIASIVKSFAGLPPKLALTKSRSASR